MIEGRELSNQLPSFLLCSLSIDSNSPPMLSSSESYTSPKRLKQDNNDQILWKDGGSGVYSYII